MLYKRVRKLNIKDLNLIKRNIRSIKLYTGREIVNYIKKQIIDYKKGKIDTLQHLAKRRLALTFANYKKEELDILHLLTKQERELLENKVIEKSESRLFTTEDQYFYDIARAFAHCPAIKIEWLSTTDYKRFVKLVKSLKNRLIDRNKLKVAIDLRLDYDDTMKLLQVDEKRFMQYRPKQDVMSEVDNFLTDNNQFFNLRLAKAFFIKNQKKRYL